MWRSRGCWCLSYSVLVIFSEFLDLQLYVFNYFMKILGHDFFKYFCCHILSSPSGIPITDMLDCFILSHSSLMFQGFFHSFFFLYFNLDNSHGPILKFTDSFLGSFESTANPIKKILYILSKILHSIFFTIFIVSISPLNSPFVHTFCPNRFQKCHEVLRNSHALNSFGLLGWWRAVLELNQFVRVAFCRGQPG